MVVAYIGLGANLGDAEGSVRTALLALDDLPATRVAAASRLFRTPAWGRVQQPAFVNAAAAVETSLPAETLLDELQALEQRFGRQRVPGQRWGPRTLDLDVLLYGQQVIAQPRLQVPHAYLHQRAFALLPLADIAADVVIPGHGTVQCVLAGVDMCGLEPIR